MQNDGTDGTPVHLGSDYGHPGTDCPCFGDYPHIGADANGFYVTTNEFRVFAPRFFNAAQIYAMPKKALAAGAASFTVVEFDTVNYLLEPDGAQGFTVWPAQSPPGSYTTDPNGTEYLLSSEAVFNESGTDDRIRVWAITNTGSLGNDDREPTTRARRRHGRNVWRAALVGSEGRQCAVAGLHQRHDGGYAIRTGLLAVPAQPAGAGA